MHQDDEGAAVHYERALAMSPNNAGIVRSYATFQAEPMERTPQLAWPRMCSACARARVCAYVCARARARVRVFGGGGGMCALHVCLACVPVCAPRHMCA
jgi:hypothetical protein